jgi:hypothetical protein
MLMRLALSLLLSGCGASFEGSVLLDGAQFVPTACENGVKLGFAGVQIEDDAGRTVRVIRDVLTNDVTVALFGSPTGTGQSLGSCAELDQHAGFGEIDGVQNQDGMVTFACGGIGHKLSGTLYFSNCH